MSREKLNFPEEMTKILQKRNASVMLQQNVTGFDGND